MTTEINIEAGKMLQMLTYAEAKGKNIKGEDKPLLEDCLMVVIPEQVCILGMDENESLSISVILKMKKEDVIENGYIPFELEKSIKIIDRFKGNDIINIRFESDTNLLYVSRKKPKLVVKEKMIPKEDVKSIIETLPFHFKNDMWIGNNSGVKIDTYIKIDASEFKETVKDGEQIKNRVFPFSIKDKIFTVTVQDIESESEIERDLKYTELKNPKDLKSLYTYGFGNCFGRLSGEIEIWIANNMPMIIRKIEGDLVLTQVLCTLDTEDEEEDEDSNTSTVNKLMKDEESEKKKEEDPEEDEEDYDGESEEESELEALIEEEEIDLVEQELDDDIEKVTIEKVPKKKIPKKRSKSKK